MSEKIYCCLCCDPLEGEEVERPNEVNEEIYCDQCYHEHFEFTCCMCQNYGHIDDMDNIVVVLEPTDGWHGKMPTGIYKVIEMPYFSCVIASHSWLHDECLERISDLPESIISSNMYPCGHLCLDCQEKVEKDAG